MATNNIAANFKDQGSDLKSDSIFHRKASLHKTCEEFADLRSEVDKLRSEITRLSVERN